jgi:hypothetical protein
MMTQHTVLCYTVVRVICGKKLPSKKEMVSGKHSVSCASRDDRSFSDPSGTCRTWIKMEKFLSLCYNQCWGSGFIDSGSGSSCSSESGSRSWSRVLMIKNWKKNNSWKISFFDQKLQFTYPYGSVKDIQATGEAFSPQKRTFSTSKEKFIKKNYFCG